MPNSGGQADPIDIVAKHPAGREGERIFAAVPSRAISNGFSPSRPQRHFRFLILPIASVLLPIIMMGAGGWIEWRTAWEDAGIQLGREADAGAEYASRVLAGYVVATGRINDVLRGLSDQEIRNREAEFHATLGRLVAELPQSTNSFVIDRNGRALASATLFPVSRDITFADRDSFVALAARSAPVIHVSQVYSGRLDGKLFFAISRRRAGAGNGLPASEFDGITSISVDPSLVATGMRRLLGEAGDVMTLLRENGQVLARSAGPGGFLPPVALASPFHGIVAGSGAGMYRAVSSIDGVARLAAVRHAEGFPVYASAARSRDAIFAEWRNRMAVHLIFGVPATLALLALSLRVRRSQLSLAARNEALQRALGESDARLRRVQTAGSVLSFEVGPDGQMICDEGFRELWGVPPNGRLELAALIRCLQPDDRDEFASVLQRLGQEGGSFHVEQQIVLPDGTRRWLMTLGEATPGAGGIAARIVGVAMDITERKQIEAAVHEREVRLQELLATLDLATVMVREFDGTIRFWSEGCVALFGWTAAEAVGRTTHELLHTIPPVPDEEIAAQLLSSGEWSGDLRQTRRDGTELIVATRKMLRRDGTGKPVAIMATAADVTAHRKTGSELEQLNQRLETLVLDEVAKREAAQQRAAHGERIQALGQLAGGIAHDLNNVLQAVISGASLATREAEHPERIRRLARMMTEAAQRGAAVTRRLLVFSRRADLRAEAIDPRGLLVDLQEVLAHTLGGHVRCEVRADAGLPRLLADRGQLETALVNLATNARDAMPDGGDIVLSATEELVSEQEPRPAPVASGRYIRIMVTDTGTGMDAATLARVPEPFFTTKREGRGTGLGLSMASGFAEQSGGALEIQSTPGQGTSASLWLPRAPAHASRMPAPVEATRMDPTHPARVLLVDDEAIVRDSLVQQLEAMGYVVSAARDGPQALAMLDDGVDLDVLLCDLSMPGMGGLAVIREAQRRRPQLPAILLTGYVGDSAALPAEGASFALLQKPATIAELTDVIAILLAGRDGANPIGVESKPR